MVYLFIIYGITLIALLFATITDLRTREVPDWLSYGLIAAGFGINLLASIIYWDFWIIIGSIAGFVIFLLVALIMFYSGQWGGGDSKVLMGLGALIGLKLGGFPFLLSLLINIIFIGAIYGLLWSLWLAVRNWRAFAKEFRIISHSPKIIRFRIYVIIAAILLFSLFFFGRRTFFGVFFLALLLMTLITFYLWIFIKAIEKTSMIKEITPDRLTEGDWIVKEIKYKGRYICGPKDLGIEKKQIRQLIKLYKLGRIEKVMIKEGIPFVPSFLLAFIFSLVYGNVLLLFL